jgi:hypothetical protein
MPIHSLSIRRVCAALTALALVTAAGCRDATLSRPGLRSPLELVALPGGPPDDASTCQPNFRFTRVVDGAMTYSTNITAGQKYYVDDTNVCGISSWGTYNPAIISISGGVRATLQAKMYDPQQISVTIWGQTTAGVQYSTNLTISRASLVITDHATMAVGGTATLYLEAYDIDGARIPASFWPTNPQFTSDNPAIATAAAGAVSGNGMNVIVTGKAAGSTVVRTGFLGGNGAAVITVNSASAASITLNTTQVWMVQGTYQLVATVKDAAGNVLTKPVSWSTSDASVATVSQTGKVTAVSGGGADIRATVDGISASTHISVDNGCNDCGSGGGLFPGTLQ